MESLSESLHLNALYRYASDSSISISCPVLAQQYNMNMGVCDKNDQLAVTQVSEALSLAEASHVRSAYNAYILGGYKWSHAPAGHRCRSFGDFLDDLVIVMI